MGTLHEVFLSPSTAKPKDEIHIDIPKLGNHYLVPNEIYLTYNLEDEGGGGKRKRIRIFSGEPFIMKRPIHRVTTLEGIDGVKNLKLHYTSIPGGCGSCFLL